MPGPTSASATAPQRIVSLNPCLDVILVNVADRAQVAAISHYARDPDGSNIAHIAQSFPITYESAEEVVALAPDLVLAGRHSSPATRNALRRLGVRAELFGVPETVADSLDQVNAIAALCGRSS
ncbi:MAG: ABC transporter substrate-binding protein, partial [Phenylobacterium sp.]|uniref:ABC transporter substrate-binding protein n=1 Tax=Phenylobacterium sp. TaxID=1871053 RepID=UPI002764E28C|nr:ABC transporter substrate-binding protein [Phenylobacterium sp.]